MSNSKLVSSVYRDLQSHICQILEKADGKGNFQKLEWKKELGTGLTCVLEKGNLIEKAGVNFSQVSGILSEKMKVVLGIPGSLAGKYTATGISSIIHSSNPFIPTIHFNIRYFELSDGTSWFGGGTDLTPIYIDLDEARLFHHKLKMLCDKHSDSFYDDFKTWADNYFFLPHRNETRGVGGIFFDRISPDHSNSFEHLFNFTQNLAAFYPTFYAGVLENKRNKNYSDHNLQWQRLRFGRYVEFNLLYDRGTKFGIETGGNTESILISLPPLVSWQYNYQPESGSPEEKTLSYLRKGIDWLQVKPGK